jgi:hypothetical protein
LKAIGLLGLISFSLPAANFSYTGAFSTDDQIQLFSIGLSATTDVTFETLSFGGGTNSAGSVIQFGGFDPRLTWFQSDGTEIGSNAGPHCGPNGPYIGACNDAFFLGTLAAGNYTLALTQDGNDPNGALSDGFSQTGNPNFTATGSCSQFCDSLSGDQLTNSWAVDILFVSSSGGNTPEPGTAALGGIALTLLALTSRKRSL